MSKADFSGIIIKFAKLEVFDSRDLAYGDFFARNSKAGTDCEALPFVAAWLSQWTQRGNVCLKTGENSLSGTLPELFDNLLQKYPIHEKAALPSDKDLSLIEITGRILSQELTKEEMELLVSFFGENLSLEHWLKKLPKDNPFIEFFGLSIPSNKESENNSVPSDKAALIMTKMSEKTISNLYKYGVAAELNKNLKPLATLKNTNKVSHLKWMEPIKPLCVNSLGNALYFQKWYKAEKRVENEIKKRLSKEKDPKDITVTLEDSLDNKEQFTHLTQSDFDFLFPKETLPNGQKASDNDQCKAAFRALSHKFSIITGGPGTGKTTTILKFLYLYLKENPQHKVCLCAPTGKARARLTESVSKQRNHAKYKKFEEDNNIDFANLVSEPKTIHRLLRINPLTGKCVFNEGNTLPYDLVVIDETSMVDLLLFNSLLKALPENASLCLVGDKDQLPAVGTGSIFSDLCVRLSKSDVVSELKRNYRSGVEEIINLATQIKNAADDKSSLSPVISGLNKLKEANLGKESQVTWINPDEDKLSNKRQQSLVALAKFHELLEKTALPYWEQLRKCSAKTTKDIKKAFDILSKFQVLCAVKDGNFGVNAVNQWAIEKEALKSNLYSFNIFSGLPIMITVNDYELDLTNGDVGIILEDPNNSDPLKKENSLKAYFLDPADPDNPRSFAPFNLPSFVPNYSMTIHKSQGSEYEEILAVLPDTLSPILTMELLYTAVTRAKKKVYLWAGQDILNDTTVRRVERVSGLFEEGI